MTRRKQHGPNILELITLRAKLNGFEKSPLLTRLVEVTKSANTALLQSELEPYHKNYPGLLPPPGSTVVVTPDEWIASIERKLDELHELARSLPPVEEETQYDGQSYREDLDLREAVKLVEDSLPPKDLSTASRGQIERLGFALYSLVRSYQEVSGRLRYGVAMMIYASFEDQLKSIAEWLGKINRYSVRYRQYHRQHKNQDNTTISVAEDYLKCMGYSFGQDDSARAHEHKSVEALRVIRNCIAHDGRVDFDDRLAKYISEFPNLVRYGDEEIEITDSFLSAVMDEIDDYFKTFYDNNRTLIDSVMTGAFLRDFKRRKRRKKKTPANLCDPPGLNKNSAISSTSSDQRAGKP